MDMTNTSAPAAIPLAPSAEITSLRQISREQWRSGAAAWLGWTFDGLDMHLYVLVATPFVAELLRVASPRDIRVDRYGSIIQGAFLLGWALGGGFFGRIGDRMGRARALSLTVLTYAVFTGSSFFAQAWCHLLIFRFLAALGIGGEWAFGASLLSETWPRKWRPWIAAVLQSGVNIGIVVAVGAHSLMAHAPHRYIFLVGIVPALMVFWIRRAVPEPEEWRAARQAAAHSVQPGVRDLFRGPAKQITIWVVLVCAVSLTAHWAFMFWYLQHLRNLPEVIGWNHAAHNRLVDTALFTVMISSIMGNFFCGWLARLFGYRNAIALALFAYFFAMFGAYCVPRDHASLLWWFPLIGFCQGTFALFTMYLPPLFPTLLRTTGAGFSYNIGRSVAAFGTVFFGLLSTVDNGVHHVDHRAALFYASFLFLPAAAIALFLPRLKD